MSLVDVTPEVVYVSDVSSGNSTSTPLAGGATFTGVGEEVKDFAEISLFLVADQPSAIDGLQFQSSPNNVTWFTTDNYTYSGSGNAKYLTIPASARYFRFVYVNGVAAQGIFHAQVLYRRVRSKPSSHNLRESLSEENDAELVKAIIAGKKPDGTFVNASFDSVGRFIVSSPAAAATRSGFALGELTHTIAGTLAVQKTPLTEQTTNAQRSIVSSNVNDTAAGTGARTVRVKYYDQTGEGPFTVDLTLNGTAAVNTGVTNICFVESMEVLTVGSTGSNVGTISLTAATGGAGGTIISIAATDNQTLLALHYVPLGDTCFITSLSVHNTSTQAGNGDSFFLRAQTLGVANTVNRQISDVLRFFPQTSSIARVYLTPIEVVGPARVQLYLVPEGNGAVTSRGSFDFYEQAT